MDKMFLPALLVYMVFNMSYFSIEPCQESTEMAKEVSAAIQKANARDVAKFFGTNVDLKLPGNEGTYSRNQAELILRNFFTRNAPKSFTIQHQGPSRDGSVYVIGTFTSQNGKSYRTYFLLKKISDQVVLHLLQMEEQ